MAFNPNAYQTLYGFDTLDMAHNFLPEMLYDEQLFPQVPLMWIRHRLRTLFPTVFVRQQNLYTMYQSTDRRTAFNRWYNTIETRPAPTTPLRPAPAPLASPPVMQRAARRARPVDPMTELTNIGLSSLLFDGFLNNVPNRNFMFNIHEDVPVVPTAAQIASGSTSVRLAEIPADTTCAVCQERGEEEQWRKLHCGHFFHNRCILQWFELGTHCPVCRADIREPPTAVQP
jgi:hypothetical protein